MKTKIFSLTVMLAASMAMFAEGGIPGQFSINENGKKVIFSQGNLQYNPAENVWRFAEKQYDMIGADNANISPTYNGYIDLFGWGTGNNPTLASEGEGDYATFTDWGIHPISNGTNTANKWRTLSKLEWEYLIYDRANADKLRALATVNGVHGCILLPDAWKLPQGLSFAADATTWAGNVYTEAQWQQMEQAGAVFLPAMGSRLGTKFRPVAADGSSNYWSNTKDNENSAWSVSITDGYSIVTYTHYLQDGLGVRLVTEDLTQDVESIQPSEVSHQKVLRDGQVYVMYKGTEYNVQGQRVE
jgi:hypothetical protein